MIIYKFFVNLVICREDLKRWFLQQELDLFRFRFLKENAEDKQKFLKVNSLDYNPVCFWKLTYTELLMLINYMKEKNAL